MPNLALSKPTFRSWQQMCFYCNTISHSKPQFCYSNKPRIYHCWLCIPICCCLKLVNSNHTRFWQLVALFEIAEHFWTWPVSLSDAWNYHMLPTLSYFPSMFITCCRLTKNTCSMVWNHQTRVLQVGVSWFILGFPVVWWANWWQIRNFQTHPRSLIILLHLYPDCSPIENPHLIFWWNLFPYQKRSIVGC